MTEEREQELLKEIALLKQTLDSQRQATEVDVQEAYDRGLKQSEFINKYIREYDLRNPLLPDDNGDQA